MSSEVLMEQRLSAVEEAIAEIRRQLPMLPPSDWLGRVIGSLGDEPAFEEVLDYGRAYRLADRPPGDEGP